MFLDALKPYAGIIASPDAFFKMGGEQLSRLLLCSARRCLLIEKYFPEAEEAKAVAAEMKDPFDYMAEKCEDVSQQPHRKLIFQWLMLGNASSALSARAPVLPSSCVLTQATFASPLTVTNAAQIAANNWEKSDERRRGKRGPPHNVMDVGSHSAEPEVGECVGFRILVVSSKIVASDVKP
uniref:Uncharacterized protein n=1 Tax=Trichuris muris TaxID=70415 RepID=A0A5S6QR50_TRIMR